MSIKIYHNNRCSKSRCAIDLLNEHNVSYEIIDYLKNVPSKKELKEVLALLNIPAFDLIRKNEADYKEHFKGKELSDDEWIDAMIQFPKLIERPIVLNGKKAVVGRPTEKIITIL